jgi:hypothetical protein
VSLSSSSASSIQLAVIGIITRRMGHVFFAQADISRMASTALQAHFMPVLRARQDVTPPLSHAPLVHSAQPLLSALYWANFMFFSLLSR